MIGSYHIKQCPVEHCRHCMKFYWTALLTTLGGCWPAFRLTALGDRSWSNQVTKTCGTTMMIYADITPYNGVWWELLRKGLRDKTNILRQTPGQPWRPHANITACVTSPQTPLGDWYTFFWTPTAVSKGSLMWQTFPHLSPTLDYELPEARTTCLFYFCVRRVWHCAWCKARLGTPMNEREISLRG